MTTLAKSRTFGKATVHGGTQVDVSLEFKLEYVWIGAFPKNGGVGRITNLHLWICLLPCLPIHIHVLRVAKRKPEVAT